MATTPAWTFHATVVEIVDEKRGRGRRCEFTPQDGNRAEYRRHAPWSRSVTDYWASLRSSPDSIQGL